MPIHNPLHPGLLVKNALIDNTGFSVTKVAFLLDVSRVTLSRLLNCHAGISPEMAERLGRFFENSPESWLNLQSHYDLWVVRQQHSKIKVKPLRLAA